MAHTFNVDIGKKQIDKQSGRIEESFWVSHTMENYHAPKFKVQSSSNVENQEKAKCKTGLKKKNIMRCQTRWKELSGPNSQCGSGIIIFSLHYSTLLHSSSFPPPSKQAISVGLDPCSRPRFDRFEHFEFFFFFFKRPAPAGALFMGQEQCTKVYEQ